MKFRNFLTHLITTALIMFGLILPVSAADAAPQAVNYRAYVSGAGWQEYVASPNEAGTTGQGLPIEAIEIQDNPALDLTVQPHVSDIGWMDPVTDAVAGVTDDAKHLEAVKISVTGDAADQYDVYYRAHVSNLGWMDWVSNGAEAGTTGQGLPIEAICIRVEPKEEAAPVAPSTDDASGFVALNEAIPDVMQEVRYYSTYNFVGDRIDGYEEPTILMTKETAEALKAVNDELMAQGLRLKVYDAYRPQMAVDHFVRWAKDIDDQRMKAYFYPNVDKSVLFEQDYIAEKSGHTRGSTVDLTVFNMTTGKDLDMGGTFDLFDERSHPDFQGDLTAEQLANRNLLREAMMRHGFRPLASEWWHFTLENEPYPDTYFTFPVSDDSVAK